MKKLFILSFLLFFLVACGPENKESTVDAVGNKDLIDQQSSKFAYENSKYSFALKTFPRDFEVNYLPDDTGISFKKSVKMDPNKNKKNPDFDYNVQIYILTVDNTENYKDLSQFISKKYHDYSFRFVDYGTVSGYFVDDGVYTDANPHFFTMSKDADLIYQVDMKLPSRYYPGQKEAFEGLVKSMVIL